MKLKLETINELQQTILILKDIYDDVRVIDPISKKILLDKNFNVIENKLCYEICDFPKSCKNCIGMRAHNQKKSFVKLSFVGEELFLITSIPKIIEDKLFIIEVFKLIEDILVIDGLKFKNKAEVKNYVEELDNVIIRDENTEIYNKMYTYERLPTDICLAKEYKKNIYIMMLEISKLENIEDIAMEFATFNAISSIERIINKNYDWISKIDENKFLIAVIRENVDMCDKVLHLIMEQLKEKSNKNNGLKYSLSYFNSRYDFNDTLEDSEQLIKRIISSMKRYNV
ncbi:hypothetical protein SDC9_146021 [bioreactor metagenome]|uniref:GGDEF domain-containing protein n=1 Tax=bioreactor metagenome TaxID=1076179 RepID=A0A645EBX4_9ZZZZ